MKFLKLDGAGNEYLFNPLKKGGAISPIIWVCRAKKGKDRLCVSLKTDNKPEARRLRDQVFEKWLGLEKKKSERILLEKVQEHLLDQKKSLVKKSTLDQMKYVWTSLESHFGGLFIDELNASDWKNYCSKMRAKNPDRTLFNEYKHLTRLITYSFESGLISHTIKLEIPKDNPTKAKVFKPEQITALLKHADPVYMKYMIPMGLELGMRTHEITQLPKSYIDLKEKVIRLPASYTKTGQARTIPLGHLFALIKEKMTSNDSPFLFPSPNDATKPIGRDGHKKAWNACKKTAGVEGRFYDLRHTCATKMAKLMAPALAAKILGHDLKMFFKVYCKPTDTDLKTEFRKMSSNG